MSELVEDEKQKLLYVFDYMTERCFFIELSEIITGKEMKGAKCTKKAGEAPKQTIDFEEMAAPRGSLDLDEIFFFVLSIWKISTKSVSAGWTKPETPLKKRNIKQTYHTDFF